MTLNDLPVLSKERKVECYVADTYFPTNNSPKEYIIALTSKGKYVDIYIYYNIWTFATQYEELDNGI